MHHQILTKKERIKERKRMGRRGKEREIGRQKRQGIKRKEMQHLGSYRSQGKGL